MDWREASKETCCGVKSKSGDGLAMADKTGNCQRTPAEREQLGLPFSQIGERWERNWAGEKNLEFYFEYVSFELLIRQQSGDSN